MKGPWLSIIVPNYNHERFLQKRLDSIFNQTFQDFEVVLLDDASTDNSGKILNYYANHPKVSYYIQNSENSGSPFLQWKRGIELAKGKFIWIAESDDYSSTKFLEKISRNINSETVLAYCASININSHNEILGVNNWAEKLDNYRWKKDFRNNGKDEIKNYLKYRNTIPNASAVLFKKEALDLNKIPVDMTFCGDWYLWLEILKKGDIAFTANPLNYFRKHTTITSSMLSRPQEIKRFKEYMKIIRSQSFFLQRIFNFKKYDWINLEKCRKKVLLKGLYFYHLNFPLDLAIRYYFIC